MTNDKELFILVVDDNQSHYTIISKLTELSANLSLAA